MRRVLLALAVGVGATGVMAAPVSAAPVRHFQTGQQWTVEFVTGPGQYGTACAIEAVGQDDTLTMGFPFSGAAYRGGASNLSEHFVDTTTSNTFHFHGTWSASLNQYSGQWRVGGRKGWVAPGKYPGQVVDGAVTSVGGNTCFVS